VDLRSFRRWRLSRRACESVSEVVIEAETPSVVWMIPVFRVNNCWSIELETGIQMGMKLSLEYILSATGRLSTQLLHNYRYFLYSYKYIMYCNDLFSVANVFSSPDPEFRLIRSEIHVRIEVQYLGNPVFNGDTQ
jgi:hypothetical protein